MDLKDESFYRSIVFETELISLSPKKVRKSHGVVKHHVQPVVAFNRRGLGYVQL